MFRVAIILILFKIVDTILILQLETLFNVYHYCFALGYSNVKVKTSRPVFYTEKKILTSSYLYKPKVVPLKFISYTCIIWSDILSRFAFLCDYTCNWTCMSSLQFTSTFFIEHCITHTRQKPTETRNKQY